MYAAYLRGEGYLQSGHALKAAAEFSKLIAQRGAVANFPTGALAHVGLARALSASGNAASRKEYEIFLNLWKDADPDIPILKQAKAEYAKLR